MKHYESISEYNDVIYNSRPVKLDDYLSDKYNIVHNELYNDALTYIKATYKAVGQEFNTASPFGQLL
jgi:hypothetical protein